MEQNSSKLTQRRLSKTRSLCEEGLNSTLERLSQRRGSITKQASESSLSRNMTIPLKYLSREELEARCEQYERRYKKHSKEAKQYADENVKLLQKMKNIEQQLLRMEIENQRLRDFIDRINEVLESDDVLQIH